MNTVKDFIDFAVEKFEQEEIYFGHGTDNSWDEALYLILSTLNLPLDSGEEVLERKLSDDEKELLIKIIDDRVKNRVPGAYLTKESWFGGLPFYVDERVLIPRSPLAELIGDFFVPWVDPDKVTRILDIGTGSGCIAIVCAYAFPNAKVDAIDISDDALDVAKINLEKHKDVADRVRILKSDLFENIPSETYDIIISNPPYVGSLEMESLPKEYSHEPRLALFSGDKGDEIADRIIKESAKHLNPKGILVVEVGNSADLIMEKYENLPFIWLDFAMGEAEVFLLTKEQLSENLRFDR